MPTSDDELRVLYLETLLGSGDAVRQYDPVVSDRFNALAGSNVNDAEVSPEAL